MSNNKVTLTGLLNSNITLSHSFEKYSFLKFEIKVKRNSDYFDTIPVIINEVILSNEKIDIDELNEALENEKEVFLTVTGEFRSHNKIENEKNHLLLFVFGKNLKIETESKFYNNIKLNGYLCKKPIYRITPLGRKIADILIAVNRNFKKSDYIPCIVWSENASFVSELEVSSNISVDGRIQSREYKKLNESSGDIIQKIAYEVSIDKILESNLNVMEEEKK